VIFYSSLLALISGVLAWMMVMPGRSWHGPLPALSPDEIGTRDQLQLDVVFLAGEEAIGERNTMLAGTLDRSAEMIEERFEKAGWPAKRLPYDDDGTTVVNLEAVREGTSRKDRIVVVGAHYDSVPGAPGADDNASGVAVLLALARRFRAEKFARTVRFVAFVNEEPPHFWNPNMGSLVYAKACKARNDDIVAMLSLETLGYYRDEPGTQKYPPVVSWFYPSSGNFVGFVGNLGSRSLVRDSVRVFREAAHFPSEGAALPSAMQGVGWSDQWSFWQVGYPGVMVTDTAPFRNPNYHTKRDRPDTLDYDRLTLVERGLEAVVRSLANGD
jgi:hypothetical protein